MMLIFLGFAKAIEMEETRARGRTKQEGGQWCGCGQKGGEERFYGCKITVEMSVRLRALFAKVVARTGISRLSGAMRASFLLSSTLDHTPVPSRVMLLTYGSQRW